MSNVRAMIQEFLNYLKYERNLSQCTVDSYGEDLRMFQEYCEALDEPLPLESADSDVVRGWVEAMMDRGGKPTSVNRRLSALRSFYRFAVKRKLVAKDPSCGIVGPKKSKPVPAFVREKDMQRLLDGEGMWDDTKYKDVRARTIISMFYNTGVRLAELIGMDDGDVDYIRKQVTVTGKRNKQRIIPLGEKMLGELRHYTAMRNDAAARATEALFVNDKGERMGRAQVSAIVKEGLSRVTTQKKRSPHVLRHTFATAMLNDDAGIESVRLLLGHAGLDATEIYTHATFEQLRKAYEKAHPRSE
ncbi:MAG: tyrosine-type recombinase/integrase [Prevotella sp.]|nr:tyrosine-type recombinase/integrase [Prevotella sp.]